MFLLRLILERESRDPNRKQGIFGVREPWMAVGDRVLKEEVVVILGVVYSWGIAWCGGKWRDLFRTYR